MLYVLFGCSGCRGIGKGVIGKSSSFWSHLSNQNDWTNNPPLTSLTASSTGLLLKTTGLSVTAIKIDPYMNIDAGTMAPTEHGEVYVLNDGGEADLDLGNYERYLDVTLGKDNNITTGKVYSHVIEREVSPVPGVGIVVRFAVKHLSDLELTLLWLVLFAFTA
jgi:hypothetical protein